MRYCVYQVGKPELSYVHDGWIWFDDEWMWYLNRIKTNQCEPSSYWSGKHIHALMMYRMSWYDELLKCGNKITLLVRKIMLVRCFSFSSEATDREDNSTYSCNKSHVSTISWRNYRQYPGIVVWMWIRCSIERYTMLRPDDLVWMWVIGIKSK